MPISCAQMDSWSSFCVLSSSGSQPVGHENLGDELPFHRAETVENTDFYMMVHTSTKITIMKQQWK